MNYNDFGRAVLLRRKALGMNQSQVARAENIGYSTVNEIEVRGRLPRVDTAAMLAAALNTTVDELLNGGPCPQLGR